MIRLVQIGSLTYYVFRDQEYLGKGLERKLGNYYYLSHQIDFTEKEIQELKALSLNYDSVYKQYNGFPAFENIEAFRLFLQTLKGTSSLYLEIP